MQSKLFAVSVVKDTSNILLWVWDYKSVSLGLKMICRNCSLYVVDSLKVSFCTYFIISNSLYSYISQLYYYSMIKLSYYSSIILDSFCILLFPNYSGITYTCLAPQLSGGVHIFIIYNYSYVIWRGHNISKVFYYKLLVI